MLLRVSMFNEGTANFGFDECWQWSLYPKLQISHKALDLRTAIFVTAMFFRSVLPEGVRGIAVTCFNPSNNFKLCRPIWTAD
jgi:hypothetical protein